MFYNILVCVFHSPLNEIKFRIDKVMGAGASISAGSLDNDITNLTGNIHCFIIYLTLHIYFTDLCYFCIVRDLYYRRTAWRFA